MMEGPRPPPPAPGPVSSDRGGAAPGHGGSGPRAARLFHRLLAGCFVVAWLSLGSQIEVLVGSRGLRPLAPVMAQARQRGLAGLVESPTLFFWGAGDRALTLGTWLGAALAVAALLRLRPRLCLLLTTLLYYSYAAPLAGIWYPPDNLLLECGLLAALLPEDAPAPVAHLLFRLLLFKLYFQPGLAKLQSRRHDWIDGTAMMHYYEVTPVPARLAWYLHKLPAAWHRLESWGVLGFEILAPLAAFAARRWRLGAAAVFTGFQLLNIATANFGLFAYLSLALNVFLLDDADLGRMEAWLRLRLRLPAPGGAAPAPPLSERAAALRRRGVRAAAALYVAVSLTEALDGARGIPRPSRWLHAFGPYRMFDYVRSERIDPELQTFDGERWSARPLRYLPVNPAWPPGYVAPHLPRIDVGLGFYEAGREPPPTAGALLARLCRDPAGVEGLFAEPLPDHPRAARIALFRDRFTTTEERRATGAFWHREPAGLGAELTCGELAE